MLETKAEEEKKAMTLPSPIQRKMSRVPGMITDKGDREWLDELVWSSNHSLSRTAAFMGNGRPTVHGSLLQLAPAVTVTPAGNGADNGCTCGAADKKKKEKRDSAESSDYIEVPAVTVQKKTTSAKLNNGHVREPPPAYTKVASAKRRPSPPSAAESDSITTCEHFNRNPNPAGNGNGNGVGGVIPMSADECSSSLPNDEEEEEEEVSSVELYVCSHGTAANHHHHTARCTGGGSHTVTPDASSSIDGGGGGGGGGSEYPLLLQSYPHQHFLPHHQNFHSSKTNGGRPKLNGAPPQMRRSGNGGETCRCMHCGLAFTPATPIAPPPPADILPLIVHADNTAAAAGSASGCKCRKPSIDSYEDADKDTPV